MVFRDFGGVEVVISPFRESNILAIAGIRNQNNSIFDTLESLAHIAMQAGMCSLEAIDFDVSEVVRSEARKTIVAK